MAGTAVLREVRQNLSHDTTKLKTMAGKTTGDIDMGRVRMGVNDKMRIRRVGKEAGSHGQGGPIPLGKIAARKRPQHGLVFGMAVPIHTSGVIHCLLQMM